MREPGFFRPGISRPRRASRLGPLLWGLFLAGVALSAITYLRGPALALDRFEVEGCRRAKTRDVFAILSASRGRSLLTLNLAPISAALERVPWVERVRITKQFPDTLNVSIVEAVPVALRRRGTDLYWLDLTGREVERYDPRQEAADLPVITAGDDRLGEAVKLVSALGSEIPRYAARLSEVWSLPSGGFGMMDSIFRKPIDVLSGDAVAKLQSLLALESEIERRDLSAREIDLRFSRRIVLKGAFGGGKSV
jgi:cell division septal protein FtsQ